MAKLTEKQLEWVYKQCWFPKYCVNLIKLSNPSIYEKLINEIPDDLIQSAFSWCNTSEGLIYWHNVNEEWKAYLKKSSKTIITIDEIAEKFGVDPKNVRIVKE